MANSFFFKAAVDSYSPSDDFPTLRVVPLLVTADTKAHAEIGLTTAGGHKGCCQCFVSGTYVPEKRHYYYGNFQQRYRFPAIQRPVSNREYGRQADSASSYGEGKRITRDTGVTEESIVSLTFAGLTLYKMQSLMRCMHLP